MSTCILLLVTNPQTTAMVTVYVRNSKIDVKAGVDSDGWKPIPRCAHCFIGLRAHRTFACLLEHRPPMRKTIRWQPVLSFSHPHACHSLVPLQCMSRSMAFFKKLNPEMEKSGDRYQMHSDFLKSVLYPRNPDMDLGTEFWAGNKKRSLILLQGCWGTPGKSLLPLGPGFLIHK